MWQLMWSSRATTRARSRSRSSTTRSAGRNWSPRTPQKSGRATAISKPSSRAKCSRSPGSWSEPTPTPAPGPTPFAGTTVSVLAVPGLAAQSPDFLQTLAAMADRHGWNADGVAAVMSHESGVNPAAVNPGPSHATGLIQFLESTAETLGTTQSALRSMSAVEQLQYVERFFVRMLGSRKPPTAGDYIFAPYGRPAIWRSPRVTTSLTGKPAATRPSPALRRERFVGPDRQGLDFGWRPPGEYPGDNQRGSRSAAPGPDRGRLARGRGRRGGSRGRRARGRGNPAPPVASVMSYRVTLAPGPYVAGLNRPFFVSRGMVEARAKTEGFGKLTWYDRATDSPMVNPKHDPNYSDDWDEWFSAEYEGIPRTAELPASPAWLLRNAGQGTPEAVQFVPEPWVGPAVTAGVAVGLVAAGALLRWMVD